MSASIGSAGNFLTWSSLIQTEHHLSTLSGCSLSAPPSPISVYFLSFALALSLFLSIMAHLNGLTLSLSRSLSPTSFTISRPVPSFHPSLVGSASQPTLSFSLSFCLPLLYPSVQSSVSKRLAVVCCAKPSAQIWITAVWRYV